MYAHWNCPGHRKNQSRSVPAAQEFDHISSKTKKLYKSDGTKRLSMSGLFRLRRRLFRRRDVNVRDSSPDVVQPVKKSFEQAKDYPTYVRWTSPRSRTKKSQTTLQSIRKSCRYRWNLIRVMHSEPYPSSFFYLPSTWRKISTRSTSVPPCGSFNYSWRARWSSHSTRSYALNGLHRRLFLKRRKEF